MDLANNNIVEIFVLLDFNFCEKYVASPIKVNPNLYI